MSGLSTNTVLSLKMNVEGSDELVSISQHSKESDEDDPQVGTRTSIQRDVIL